MGHSIGMLIFASQGLRSAPLLSTLGRLSQNFVIPAYRPLADLWSSAHLHYIIINQWEQLYYYLFEGTSVNWANTLKVSVNIVLLCLGGKDSWQSLQFSPHVAIVYIFLSKHVIVAWSFVGRILIGRSHPLLHRIENNTVRTRNSDLIYQGWRGEDRNTWLAKMRYAWIITLFIAQWIGKYIHYLKIILKVSSWYFDHFMRFWKMKKKLYSQLSLCRCITLHEEICYN